MAEIELSALAKQCLDRRILTKKVVAWVAKSNRQQTKITWHFTKSIAREKLNRAIKSLIINLTQH
jgi:DNA polymerase III delta subunit